MNTYLKESSLESCAGRAIPVSSQRVRPVTYSTYRSSQDIDIPGLFFLVSSPSLTIPSIQYFHEDVSTTTAVDSGVASLIIVAESKECTYFR